MNWAFEQSPDCIKLMAPNGALLAMNRNGQKAMEIDDVEKVYGAQWVSLWPDAARPVVLDAIAAALAGHVARFDALCPTARGAPKWWDVVVTPLLGEDGRVERLLAVSRDISAVREAIDKELETAARLQFTLNATGLGEWALDLASGDFQRNLRFDQCFGHLDGAPHWDVDTLIAHIHADDRARVDTALATAIASHGYLGLEARVRWSDGSVHWINMQGGCYRSADRADRLIGIVSDITERMLLTEALHDASRKKDEFLAMLAHELRNPLAPISAAAQILATGRADARMTQKAGAVIDRQARHMNHLLDDLLDTARVTQGLVSLDMRQIDLKRVIADALEQARPMIEQYRHHLNVQLDPCAARVMGDDKRLIQVLVNLLNNAAKYTPEGGTIGLRLDCEDGKAHIKVSDNGIGMDETTLSNAFGLFSQAARSAARTSGGLGLGLALVKSLVERHHGVVSAHSEGKGRGSHFLVALPMLEESHAALSGDDTATRAAGDGRGALRILIVDDNRDAAEMLGMVLASAGHHVDMVFSATDAIAHAGSKRPDVFLLDVGLPDMNGYDLARRLRTMPTGRGATMIAITGYGSPADRASSRRAGIDHHLTKPVDPSQLEALLARVTPQ
jgi:signal transduction histidine kinase